MTGKRLVIYIVIAVLVGVLLGGISKLFDIDFSPIIIVGAPVLILLVASGTDYAISKKNKK